MKNRYLLLLKMQLYNLFGINRILNSHSKKEKLAQHGFRRACNLHYWTNDCLQYNYQHEYCGYGGCKYSANNFRTDMLFNYIDINFPKKLWCTYWAA